MLRLPPQPNPKTRDSGSTCLSTLACKTLLDSALFWLQFKPFGLIKARVSSWLYSTHLHYSDAPSKAGYLNRDLGWVRVYKRNEVGASVILVRQATKIHSFFLLRTCNPIQTLKIVASIFFSILPIYPLYIPKILRTYWRMEHQPDLIPLF